MASKARDGELVPLPWKGGVEKKLKMKNKYGVYQYLAMWQGLRGDDLQINTDSEVTLICTKFGMSVVFTDDVNKYGGP